MKGSHSVVHLNVSNRAFTEVSARLREAGYGHVLLPNDVIDMQGISLVRESEPRSALVINSTPDGVRE